MKALTAVFLASCLTSLAFAQSRPFLSKADVETLASGKTWSYLLPTGGSKGDTMEYSLKAGGSLVGVNLQHAYAPETGTWLVNDQAQLCVKFFRRFTDRCVAVLKEGEKFTLVDSSDLNGVYAEFTVK
jgi:hypothetical protein